MHPIGIWTLKKDWADKNDSFIIMSTINSTTVLSVGEKVVPVKNSGFDLES